MQGVSHSGEPERRNWPLPPYNESMSHYSRKHTIVYFTAMCTATSVEEALGEVRAILSLGHALWAYAYLRMLHEKRPHLYFGALLAAPDELLPVVYTPTVGEACQKFGRMPFYSRGCYVSLTQRGELLNKSKRLSLPQQ